VILTLISVQDTGRVSITSYIELVETVISMQTNV